MLSTLLSTLVAAAAERPAEQELFTQLVDDAAVFPPGNAPLDDAVRAHLGYQAGRYAGLIGPLLVPVSDAAGLDPLASAVGCRPETPLAVALVARIGVPSETVTKALAAMSPDSAVRVVGVEVGWAPEWRTSRPPGLPLTLEVPRGGEQDVALGDIARDLGGPDPLQAKFRTGATRVWAWPDEEELAQFIRSAVDLAVGFKLTGGLHHAVRGRYAVGEVAEEQHGLLNVVCAVRWALNGADVPELVTLLAQRDPGELVAMVTRMSSADVSIVRAFFTSFGCCQVTDPIAELVALNLLEEP